MGGNAADYKELSNEELVALFKNGEKKALDVLTERFFKPSAKTVGGAGWLDRDDLLQEGMFGFLYAVKNYSPEKNVPFGAYAYMCINDRIKTAVKKAKNGFLISDETALFENEASGVDVVGAVEDNELLGHVLNMCETRLSGVEKTVLFCKVSGLSYDEISQKLGISQKAVDNALQRARKKLKDIMA